jgi:hypothetical protein
MGDEFGNLAGTRWADLGRNIARRTRMTCGVQPDPLPSDSLSQRPVQDDVHSVDSSRCERAAHSPSASAQVGIKAIDVRRRQLRDRQVSEMGLQVVFDEALLVSRFVLAAQSPEAVSNQRSRSSASVPA